MQAIGSDRASAALTVLGLPVETLVGEKLFKFVMDTENLRY